MENWISTLELVLGPVSRETMAQLRRVDTQGFLKDLPLLVCSFQDCNIGGSFLRNFYWCESKLQLYYFVCGCHEFPSDEYDVVLVEDYLWKRTLLFKKIDES